MRSDHEGYERHPVGKDEFGVSLHRVVTLPRAGLRTFVALYRKKLSTAFEKRSYSLSVFPGLEDCSNGGRLTAPERRSMFP